MAAVPRPQVGALGSFLVQKQIWKRISCRQGKWAKIPRTQTNRSCSSVRCWCCWVFSNSLVKILGNTKKCFKLICRQRAITLYVDSDKTFLLLLQGVSGGCYGPERRDNSRILTTQLHHEDPGEKVTENAKKNNTDSHPRLIRNHLTVDVFRARCGMHCCRGCNFRQKMFWIFASFVCVLFLFQQSRCLDYAGMTVMRKRTRTRCAMRITSAMATNGKWGLFITRGDLGITFCLNWAVMTVYMLSPVSSVQLFGPERRSHFSRSRFRWQYGSEASTLIVIDKYDSVPKHRTLKYRYVMST